MWKLRAVGLGLLATVLIYAAECGEPSFCHGLDCPTYTVISEGKGYELRLYNATRWVGTTVYSLSWDDAGKIGIELLNDYIAGDNSAGEKIPMALPVAVKIVPGQGPACNSTFTILFFVPFRYQSNTPKPSNPSVTIIDLLEIKTYVIQYGGTPTDDTVIQNADQLADDLTRDKLNFVSDFYFTGTYDSPYFSGSKHSADRHNEVWLLAAN